MRGPEAVGPASPVSVTVMAYEAAAAADALGRMRAKAVSADTRLGQSEVDVIATQDILLRPVLPRFFTIGDRVHCCAVILVCDPGHDPFGHIGAAQDHASIVVHANDVPVLDASLFGLRWMDPDRLVQVSIDTLYLGGRDLPQPGDIVVLSMYAPSPVVGLAE